MTIRFAHLREQSTSGGWINFAVFEARSAAGSAAANAEVLSRLTGKARLSGLKVDQSALAFMNNGKITFYGNPNLVEYLSHRGVPRWTHTIED